MIPLISFPASIKYTHHLKGFSHAAFIKRNKFKHVTYHDLRHTYATLLLRKNIHMKVMSELLGHSTIVLTMDTYSHVMPAMQQEAADKVDEVLGNSGK